MLIPEKCEKCGFLKMLYSDHDCEESQAPAINPDQEMEAIERVGQIACLCQGPDRLHYHPVLENKGKVLIDKSQYINADRPITQYVAQ